MSGTSPVDSVLLVGFGGPEASAEIRPFLERVAAGRPIPEARLREVEEHYLQVGGSSPYNRLTERLRSALEDWLRRKGRPLPVLTGMKHAPPFLGEVLARMKSQGCGHAAGIILAAHRSEASWDRYQEAVRQAVRRQDGAPRVSFLPPVAAESLFIEAVACRLEEAAGVSRGRWPPGWPVIFTAHSIPQAMAERSPYVSDLEASCQGVARRLGLSDWELAYQSRSGRPGTPWLGPDIQAVLRRRASAGSRKLFIEPVGFLCDHVEVLFDLDVEAARQARDLGLEMVRAACVHDHPDFVALLGRQVMELQTGPSPQGAS